MNEATEPIERRELPVSLNSIKVGIAVIVSAITLAGAVGTWYVLPYRVARTEESIQEVRSDIKEVRQEIQTVKTDSSRSQELMIRIDERLRQVQRALKIPTDTN